MNKLRGNASSASVTSCSRSIPVSTALGPDCRGHRRCNHQEQLDSGSESAPLLSSSCSQLKDMLLFHRGDSETSDFDSSLAGSSSRVNRTMKSRGRSIYNSIQNILLPKRLLSSPPLGRDRGVLLATAHASLPNNLLQRDNCYEILLYEDDVLGANDSWDEKNNALDGIFAASGLPVKINADNHAIKDVEPKQSSLVTIFSVWNTILGSSLLTMPWGIYLAGFIPAVILILAMSGLCLFTAHKLLQVRKYYGGVDKIEVMELSRVYLGSWAERTAKIFSISVLLGANIAYWILMSNFLYNSVNFFYDIFSDAPLLFSPNNNSTNNDNFSNKTNGNVLCPREENFNKTMNYEKSHDSLGPMWDLYKTVPIILAFLVFPLLNFNTTTFFTKFNSLGTVSIVYLMIFVLSKCVSWGINMDKSAWEDSWILRSTFPVLSGMLSLAFFIHNIIITIMQSNRNQTKNGRDLSIAYLLVTVTYIIVGITFFVCFPLPKSCIEDNLLNNFQKNDGVTVGARVVLLFQSFTVYPLLAYMLRIQLLSSVLKTRECRTSYVLFVNFVIVAICVLFAIFLPHVGTILRYTGAISGLIYVFTLPSLLHLMITRIQGKINTFNVFCYLCVPIIGILNLISQFFISTT
ncbi:sodium-coupled neutral amino acid transporter 9-like [Copidosoma floridanum]|uniref:sodium-coupled neutral amino acid transporter 9-like n=1 Tax=Copidosoma floridanum TaxID=29053 RepID=UPI000C6F8425|nr:sodium-coupled neutral amino acid transporter 9-like [Copidosoma floridanum]